MERSVECNHASLLRLKGGWYVDECAQLSEVYCNHSHRETSDLRASSIERSSEEASVFGNLSLSSARCPRLKPDSTLWDIRTPYMMDLQAAKEAARLENSIGIEVLGVAEKRRSKKKKTFQTGEKYTKTENTDEVDHVMMSLKPLLAEKQQLEESWRRKGIEKMDNSIPPVSVAQNGRRSYPSCTIYDGCGPTSYEQKDGRIGDLYQYKSDISIFTGSSGRVSCCGLSPSPSDYRLNNRPARDAARRVWEQYSPPVPPFTGGNQGRCPQLVSVQGRQVVLPPRCRFVCGDITTAIDDVTQVERQLIAGDSKFDCIVVDPPWSNKFVRRKRKRHEREGYRRLDAASLARLPLGELAAPGALVAVWCTNSEAHLRTLQEVLLPAWGVTQTAMWYWVKVTQFGAPVTAADAATKRPYERLILGRVDAGAVSGSSDHPPPLPQHQLIVSVPCAVHSRKPLLHELLRPYVRSGYRGLEVFARGLLPGWTSWGDQVLLLQQLGALLLPDADQPA